MEIDFHASGLEQLTDALVRFASRGVPFAARNALNTSAFEARREWVRQIEESFTLRNTWTKRSVRVRKARGRRVERMVSVVGSVADYMASQEEGSTKRKRGRRGVPIATRSASGEGRGRATRRRLPRGANKLRRVSLLRRHGRSKKQRNAVAIRQARAAGQKFVFLELERSQGIFRIMGGKRRPRLEMIWDLSRASVRIPATPTLEPTMRRMESRMTNIFESAVRDQLKRHRVFGVR